MLQSEPHNDTLHGHRRWGRRQRHRRLQSNAAVVGHEVRQRRRRSGSAPVWRQYLADLQKYYSLGLDRS